MFQYSLGLCLLLCRLLTIMADFNDRSFRSDNQTANAMIAGKQMLNQHLKIIIIIGSISVGLMIIIVGTYIGLKYFTTRKDTRYSRANEQGEPLDQSTKKSRRQR